MRHFLDNFLTTYDAFESLRIGQKGNKRCDENRLNSGHLDNLSNVRKNSVDDKTGSFQDKLTFPPIRYSCMLRAD